MDYSIFKPGDKVRAIGPSYRQASGVVLFCNEKCLLVQPEDEGAPENYTTWEFEKIPERTSKFTNVYLISDSVFCSTSRYTSAHVARRNRSDHNKYIGMFEQVFEDGKLIETKYHPD